MWRQLGREKREGEKHLKGYEVELKKKLKWASKRHEKKIINVIARKQEAIICFLQMNKPFL